MMEKRLNWEQKEKKARKMSIQELNYAISDCISCKIDQGYYYDGASVYQQELNRRKNVH
jgi:hypothetical protein